MRRCHEDEQDYLDSAHPHVRCLGPHGRRGLCQVEQWHEQAAETEEKLNFRLNTEPTVMPLSQGICPAISWTQVLR